MQIFQGKNLTQNAENKEFDGKDFIKKTSADEDAETYEEYEEYKLSRWTAQVYANKIKKMRYLMYFAVVLLGMSLALIIKDSMGHPEKIESDSIFLGIAALLASGFYCMVRSLKLKQKKQSSGELVDKNLIEFEKIKKEVYDKLNVPEDATDTEVFNVNYKEENGKIAFAGDEKDDFGLSNVEAKIYANDGVFGLATYKNLYTLPLADLKSIEKVKEPVAIYNWYKNESEAEQVKTMYGVSFSNEKRSFTAEEYYILKAEHESEEIRIYFPCYELSAFEKVTGLKALN